MDNYLSKINFSFLTNQLVLKKIGSIDAFNGMWNSANQTGKKGCLQKLKDRAFGDSAAAISRAAGGFVSNSEAFNLIRNLDHLDFETTNQKNIYGYYRALSDICDNHSKNQFTIQFIDKLHQKLFIKYSDNEKQIGKYKSLANNIVANYPDGSRKLFFNTTSPYQVEQELKTLINWTNKQIETASLHPLILIGLFVYEFLLIHPYQEGNRRLTYLLMRFLLQKHNYTFIQYTSFECRIEQKQKAYIEAIRDAQKDRYSYVERLDKWMLFFLESLESLLNKPDKKCSDFRPTRSYLNARQKRIQALIKKNKSVKLADLALWLPEVSINTLKKDLQYLKKEQIIAGFGKNRGASYSLANF
jgi:Fic family protein